VKGLGTGVLVLAGIVLTAIALAAQTLSTSPVSEPRQVFRGTTTLIPVDIRVIDRAGKPVTDLSQADFVVTENGAPQSIRHFSTQDYTPDPSAAVEPLKLRTELTDSVAPQNRRVFLIVLGRGRLQPPAKGVDGALHFVRERLLPQDLVGVMAWNRATEVTTDHVKVADLLERFKKAHERIEGRLAFLMSGLAAIYGSREIPANIQGDIDALFEDPSGSLNIRSTPASEGANAVRMAFDRQRTIDDLRGAARANPGGAADIRLDDFARTNASSMQDLGKLYAGVEYLRHFDGEKHLVLVSEFGLSLPRSEDDTDLAAVAADARVVVDFIHTGGIAGAFSMSGYGADRSGLAGSTGSAGSFSPFGWQVATAGTVTELTGGRYLGGRYAKEALDDIDRASRFAYTLGYYPSNPTTDAKYRQIRVKVNRPGVRVLYRHGYYANAPAGPLDRKHMVTYSRVVAAASYPNPVPDIGIVATATASRPPATPEIQIEMTIDASRLAFTKASGRNVDDLEMLVGGLDGRDNLLSQTWKRVQLDYTDERLDGIKRTGIPVSLTLPLTIPAAAAKNVKIVVYDYAADLVGTAVVKIK
jgi:VWFA-related protein